MSVNRAIQLTAAGRLTDLRSPHARGVAKIAILLIAVLAMLAFSASSASAKTLSAWWHLTSGSRPANIQPGQAADEVERVKVSATAGSYVLIAKVDGSEHEASLEVGEEPSRVQTALEAEVYGEGNVEVKGSPGPNNAYEIYEITLIGELTHRFVEFLGSKPEGERVTGGSAEVTVEHVAEGRADGVIVATITNMGEANASGEQSPVKIVDTLPSGLKATSVVGILPVSNTAGRSPLPCSIEESGGRVSCTFVGTTPREVPLLSGVGLAPARAIEVRIPVEVQPGASLNRAQNEVGVSGGEGAACNSEAEPLSSCERVVTGSIAAASIRRPLRVSGEAARFGVEDFELTPEEAGGALDTRAGSHPFQTSFDVALNQGVERGPGVKERPVVLPAALPKDLRFKLPPGLVGNPTAFPRCSIFKFLQKAPLRDACPADTAMGVATVAVNIGTGAAGGVTDLAYTVFTVPVFNVEPQTGEPARFGFYLPEASLGVFIDTAVRTGGDYGITSTTANISQEASFLWGDVTLWGVPGDPRHNDSRGWGCLLESSEDISLEEFGVPPCAAEGVSHAPAFLDLPTSCTVNAATDLPEPLQSSVEADTWEQPGIFASLPSEPLPALDGCDHLQFTPEIKVTPDGEQTSKPTGLNVDVHVPQEGQLNGEGLAQSNIKDIEVTLPPGVMLNPSAANGLEACSGNTGAAPGAGQLGTPGDQIGFAGSTELSPGSEPGSKTPQFTPYLPGSTGAKAAVASHELSESEGALEPGRNFCPDASKIAEVTIKTPLLPNPVKGFVYLASPQNFGLFPQENPFGTHVAMYIVAEDPASGSLVKLPGRVELGGAPGVEGLAPGQIRSFFEDNPQLPFEDAEVHFFGGERAPLAGPTHCGTYTTEATFTPWSGGEAVNSSSTFDITSGPDGSPCPPAALPFTPSLASGTTNNNAGGFTPLTTTLGREDGQQNIQSVTLHYPPGLSGSLTGVALCGEVEANNGSCSSASQIGETIVSVGVGGEPFTVTGGKAYLTGPYEGAPFGLSIVNPAKAGPFDLQEGRPVIVRAKIEVNPLTAALTITTNPTGQYSIPNIVEGFPLQIQHVNVLVNRPGFTFNPTSCTPAKITGEINSAEGASSPVEVPFQATNCASLKFEPKISVSTQGHTSKADGASLTYKIAYPNVLQGTDADIHYVKVELPGELPSRLTTLQKACTQNQFQANPAGCPKESVIGHAKAVVPNIPVPLEGPVYFVSNGGEAFPNLVMVLQGYGVTIDLIGDTLIKNGVTSTTFNQVPDNPVTSFEINLPEGKFSALAANGNLCKPTKTETVKKKVKVKIKGHEKTITRKVKEQVATTIQLPNEYVAQNGDVYKYTAPIQVTGCPKAKVAKKAKTKKKKPGKGGSGKGKK
jgi:hypothetical protein